MYCRKPFAQQYTLIIKIIVMLFIVFQTNLPVRAATPK